MGTNVCIRLQTFVNFYFADNVRNIFVGIKISITNLFSLLMFFLELQVWLKDIASHFSCFVKNMRFCHPA